MNELLKSNIINNIEVLKSIKNMDLQGISQMVLTPLQNGKTLFVAGNGGSFADAQHFVGELIGRFQKERSPIRAIALGSNPVNVTAIANDYGYENIFVREINGLANDGDVCIIISTSGSSRNITEIIDNCEKNVKFIALTGKGGGCLLTRECENIIVPSKNTARIQEAHMIILHTLAEYLENELSN